jgi:hypothetical protein
LSNVIRFLPFTTAIRFSSGFFRVFLAESQFSLDNKDTRDASSKLVELNCGYNPRPAKQESPALALCYNIWQLP